MVVLYSNHCVKCNVVKSKLDQKQIEYKLVDDTEWLENNGFDLMPVLEVDGVRITSMIDINDYINKQ